MVMHKGFICPPTGPPQHPPLHTARLLRSLTCRCSVTNADRFRMARTAAPGILPHWEAAAAPVPQPACRPSAQRQVPAKPMQPDSQETIACASTSEPEPDAIATQACYSAEPPVQLCRPTPQQQQQQQQQQQTARREPASTPWRTKRSAGGGNNWLEPIAGQHLARPPAMLDTAQPPTVTPLAPRAPDRAARTPSKLPGGDDPEYKFNEVVRNKAARRDMLVRGTCSDAMGLLVIPAHAISPRQHRQLQPSWRPDQPMSTDRRSSVTAVRISSMRWSRGATTPSASRSCPAATTKVHFFASPPSRSHHPHTKLHEAVTSQDPKPLRLLLIVHNEARLCLPCHRAQQRPVAAGCGPPPLPSPPACHPTRCGCRQQGAGAFHLPLAC